jgi:starch-binding outer membrane protein SusE/F
MNNLKTQLLLTIMLFAVALSGCREENDLNLNLTEVNSLLSPADNVSVTLKPAQNPSIDFQWEQARAEDGSLVLYEVAFDQEGGDFSSPFYTTVSNGKGVENRLSLTHSELNKIASLGGADFFEKKKFIWTVMASKGSNIKKANQARTIELERPGGFDVLPTQLYITGSATENGTDASEALPMQQIDDGVFEVYTKLVPGNYQFIDAQADGANTFFINEQDGIKTVGGNGSTEYSGEEKTYRLRVDFNALSAQIDEVKSVGFWYCWENTIWFQLTYAGAGVWKADDVTVNLSAVPWGFEERHKYQVVLNDGVSDREEWWGYVGNDSPGQDGTYGSTDPAYFYAYRIENNDQWNYAWKLDRPAVNGKVVDFFMKFKGDEPYAMEYIVN